MSNRAFSLTHEHVAELRRKYPAFSRTVNGLPAAYFDGPAGTQVPTSVVDAISEYLLERNANHAGLFATSIESDKELALAQQTFADFVGASDAKEISFGQNMTSLTFAFSRALAQTWDEGDRIIVTRLDHDANITPWTLAARDRRIHVDYVDFDPATFQLDLDQLRSFLSERTKLVAVGYASNAAGTINPVRPIADLAHSVGARVFVDAVHFAPHRRVDVREIDCDFLVCSAYKFFGPHTGIFWGRRSMMEELDAYKVRPAPDSLPGKWMTGTQSFECIAGSRAAVDYIAGIGQMVSEDETLDRCTALDRAYAAIAGYEQLLSDELLDGFNAIPGIRVHGISEPGRIHDRVATFSISLDGVRTKDLAQRLCDRGHFVWHGHYYALQFSEQLGMEPEGMVRIGALHYNTSYEVQRLLNDIDIIASPKLA